MAVNTPSLKTATEPTVLAEPAPKPRPKRPAKTGGGWIRSRETGAVYAFAPKLYKKRPERWERHQARPDPYTVDELAEMKAEDEDENVL